MRAVVIPHAYVDVPVDGRPMRTFMARPREPGPHPGIVFYSDIFQLTPSTLRWCVRLAGYGFAVAAPEIYHRIEPPGTVLGFDDQGKVRGQADAEATPVADFDADVRALLAYLESDDRISALGAAGHCTGGHIAFRAAMEPQVQATACWYATGLHDGKLGADPDAGSLARAREIDGELLMIFGTRDPHTPEPGRTIIKHALEQADVNFTWSLYDAEHAFGRDIGARYDPEATDQALAETVALFRRALRPAGR
jgi:carboxymethylenebutenolidase